MWNGEFLQSNQQSRNYQLHSPRQKHFGLRTVIGNYEKIVSLIEPYLSASFILSEIPAYEELFKTEDDLVEAEIVRIVGVDFDVSSPIPSIKAEAEVELNKIESFSNIDLEKWQEENGFLYDGISFCWSFDDIDSDDLDTCIYEHEGQEIII